MFVPVTLQFLPAPAEFVGGQHWQMFRLAHDIRGTRGLFLMHTSKRDSSKTSDSVLTQRNNNKKDTKLRSVNGCASSTAFFNKPWVLRSNWSKARVTDLWNNFAGVNALIFLSTWKSLHSLQVEMLLMMHSRKWCLKRSNHFINNYNATTGPSYHLALVC